MRQRHYVPYQEKVKNRALGAFKSKITRTLKAAGWKSAQWSPSGRIKGISHVSEGFELSTSYKPESVDLRFWTRGRNVYRAGTGYTEDQVLDMIQADLVKAGFEVSDHYFTMYGDKPGEVVSERRDGLCIKIPADVLEAQA